MRFRGNLPWAGPAFKVYHRVVIPDLPASMVLWRINRKTLNTRHCLLFAVIGIGVLFLGYGMNLKPYFDGIFFNRNMQAKAIPGFLMGKYSATGWWYYFIVAFLVKTPIATMVFRRYRWFLFVGKLSKGVWINEMFLLIPAATIFCFFSLPTPMPLDCATFCRSTPFFSCLPAGGHGRFCRIRC